MRINLIKWINILEIVQKDKEMLNSFMKFYEKLKVVDWNNPNDVLTTFNSADIVKCTPSNRIVFNIGGNKYRLITGYYFGKSLVNLYVKFVGTHKEYDKIDACKINIFKR